MEKKGHIGFPCDGPGKQRFAGTRQSHKQHASGDFTPEPLVTSRCFEKLHNLD